jgi:2'-5' RNA ligase
MTDPKDEVTTGYHLFLLPHGAVAQTLQEIIEKLAHIHKSPVFFPHVTLLACPEGFSRSQMIEKTKQLAQLCAPLYIALRDIEMRDEYYRSTYLRVVDTPELLACRLKALEIFAREDEFQYVPHLSLLYGNFPEKEKIESMQHIELPQDAVFVADTISLFETEGTVGQWKHIQDYTFPL